MSKRATETYRRTPRGVLTNMYDHMRKRYAVEFTLQEFHERFLTDPRYLRLHQEWVRGGYKKDNRPSLDRINHKGNYTERNTQMMTWTENRYKQRMERRSRKGAVVQLKDGHVVARYRSQKEAVKKTGLIQGLVSAVLNGQRNHTGGYQFVYESEATNAA
jgi:hypothetical protein